MKAFNFPEFKENCAWEEDDKCCLNEAEGIPRMVCEREADCPVWAEQPDVVIVALEVPR